MSPEIISHLSENGHTVERPIASFVRPHINKINIEPDHVRAYVASRLILRNNPYFDRGVNIAPTGLEPYLIGRTSDPMEVAEEIGKYGFGVLKGLEVLDDPYALSRVKRIVNTGRISTDIEERQKDLHILKQADLAIGNTVRKLQVSMTKEGEEYRTETYKIIGNPTDRFAYSSDFHSESLILPQATDLRRELDVQRQSLDDVLARLPVHIQRGYSFVSHLLKPTLSAPVERAFLIGLRTMV